MKATLVAFGAIEIDGTRYEHDIVIDRGEVGKRRKAASKPYRDRYGHTPLSPEENIPWHGRRLIVGTGANGALPVMPEVTAEAHRRGVEVTVLPTEDACRLIESLRRRDVNAVLHVTC